MKILICLSNVPDTTTKIKFTDDNTKFDETGVQWVINPWDELALTRALELKEDAGANVEKVTVINVGLANTEPTIRKALAIGADDAIRVNAEPKDAFFVASQIANAIKDQGFDIIINGIESSDFNGSAVGGMLAEMLDLPSVSAVSAMKVENGAIVIDREIDGGKEVLSIETPFLAVVQKGIALEPRIAAMRGIMMARKKPLTIIEAVDVQAMTDFVAYEMPQPKPPCKMVDADNVKDLVNLLHNEAKVI
ncbi:MAG: electron transfer flavoprotein subunit beta/FixA family protein [Salinivirgaceae bacterium]|nr:electron transfer flavoprotein subunit beta/FixA family protein [Salinivirgaceae bacterium]